VVVITDRQVLDQQLQDTIYQFEHKQGVVQRIDENSAQLYDALQKGTRVIVTTIQKFPFVMGLAGKLPDRKYALIVDEAHSSQTGELAGKVDGTRGSQTLEEAAEAEARKRSAVPDLEDILQKQMAGKGRRKRLLLRLHGDPEGQTLELFGTMADGNRPFHLYPCGRRSRRVHPDVLKTTRRTRRISS
jgi:type I restriction enzyme R subunit